MKKLNILQIINLTIQEIRLKPLEFLRFGLPLLLIPLIWRLYDIFIINFKITTFTSFVPIIIIIYALIGMIFIIVSVGCHRTYLMTNQDIKHTKTFRLGVREWNFFAWWIKIGLIFYFLYYLPLGLLLKYFTGVPVLVTNIFIIPSIYIFSRLSFVFPATAVGNKNASLIESWKLSKHNGLQVTILIGAIPWLLNLLIDILPYNNSYVYLLFTTILWLIVGLFELGLLSMSYAYLSGYIEDD